MPERTRGTKKPRCLFAVPWTPAHIKAFQLLAEKVPTDKTQGNAAALARSVLEQFMFSVFGFDESVKLGLVNHWDQEEGKLPRPFILRFAVKKYDEREIEQNEPRQAQKSQASGGHASLPS